MQQKGKKIGFKLSQVLFLSLLFILCWSATTHAQNLKKLAGNYRLLEPKVVYKQADPNSDNYLFAQHYNSGKIITVTTSGQFTYFTNDTQKTARIEFINDKELKLIFLGGEPSKNDEKLLNSESYTIFNYTIIKSGFTISREDPLVTQSYTFKLTK